MSKVIIKAQFSDPVKRTATATLKAGIEVDSMLIVEPLEKAFQEIVEDLRTGQFKKGRSAYEAGAMEIMLLDEKTGEYRHIVIGIIEGIDKWATSNMQEAKKTMSHGREKLKSLIINQLNDE